MRIVPQYLGHISFLEDQKQDLVACGQALKSGQMASMALSGNPSQGRLRVSFSNLLVLLQAPSSGDTGSPGFSSAGSREHHQCQGDLSECFDLGNVDSEKHREEKDQKGQRYLPGRKIEIVSQEKRANGP